MLHVLAHLSLVHLVLTGFALTAGAQFALVIPGRLFVHLLTVAHRVVVLLGSLVCVFSALRPFAVLAAEFAMLFRARTHRRC